MSSTDETAVDATVGTATWLSAGVRGVYLQERFRALKTEIETLRAEAVEVREKLKEAGDATSTEARALKRRKIYLVNRPKEARLELVAVARERKELSQTDNG